MTWHYKLLCVVLGIAWLGITGCAKSDDPGSKPKRAHAGMMPTMADPTYDAHYLADQGQIKSLPPRTISREPLETFRAANRAKLEEAAARRDQSDQIDPDAATDESKDEADEESISETAKPVKPAEKAKPAEKTTPVKKPDESPPPSSGMTNGAEKKPTEPSEEKKSDDGAKEADEETDEDEAEESDADGRSEEGRDEEGRDEAERDDEGRSEDRSERP